MDTGAARRASIQVTVDAARPEALARFWAVVLGYVDQPPPPGYDSWEAFAEAHGMPPEALGDYAALIDPDVEAGGEVVARREELGDRWVVMTDPEGNEFCVQ